MIKSLVRLHDQLRSIQAYVPPSKLGNAANDSHNFFKRPRQASDIIRECPALVAAFGRVAEEGGQSASLFQFIRLGLGHGIQRLGCRSTNPWFFRHHHELLADALKHLLEPAITLLPGEIGRARKHPKAS